MDTNGIQRKRQQHSLNQGHCIIVVSMVKYIEFSRNRTLDFTGISRRPVYWKSYTVSKLYTVFSILYTVQCILYTVHFTLYSVHCTLYSVQRIVYIIKRIPTYQPIYFYYVSCHFVYFQLYS